MELTVLGCFGPYPAAGGHATSGYLLKENGSRLILDMGAGTLTRLLQHTDISSIDAVYISHLHFDHTSDLLPLRYLLDDLGVTLNVITHREDSPWYDTLFSHPRFNIISADENTAVKAGNLSLSFYKMKHPAENYAVKIKGEKTFFYTGDTVYCDALVPAAAGSDMILADCCKHADFKGPHMTCADAIRLCKETGSPLIATHLAPGYEPGGDFDGYDIRVAREGETYSF